VQTRREQTDLLAMIVQNLDAGDRQAFLECIGPSLREEVELLAPPPPGDSGGRVYDLLSSRVVAPSLRSARVGRDRSPIDQPCMIH